MANKFIEKAKISIDKHSPELLIALGIVTFVGTVVTACVATTKTKDIFEEHTQKLEAISKKPDAKKEKVGVYAQTTGQMARIYAPSVILATVSVGSFIGSNHILKKRNAALAAAYVAVNTAYNEYRKRVIEKYGEDVDFEMRTGAKKEKIETTVTDEDGKEKKVKESVQVVDPKILALGGSPYAVLITKATHSHIWNDSDEIMVTKFDTYERVLNDQLIVFGRRTLNDVLSSIGLDETKAGMVVGWIHDPECKTEYDNYIQISKEKVYLKDEATGENVPAWLLDFNVDGNIYDRLEE